MYRNTLEAYSYEMRSNLQEYGNWVKYLDDATKAAFIKDINEVVEWLYDAGEDAPKQEYKTRLDRFKAIGEPVRARYNYYDELPVYYNQFEKQIELIHNRVEAIEYLSDLQKNIITEKVDIAKKIIEGVKADAASKTLHDSPAYSIDQIVNGLNMLKN